jgi:cystathionine gamma-synthase
LSEDSRSIVRRSVQPETRSVPLGTPLQPSVAHTATDADELDAIYEGRDPGFTYAREGHQNAVVLGDKLAWLERTDDAWGPGVVTGSGMAAIGAVLLGLLEAGDHVVGGDQLYGRVHRLLSQDLSRLGFSTSFADPTDVSAIEGAIQDDTRMIIVEVVSNPTLRVADIAGIAEVARRRGVMFVVDNTFTTPRAFQPFAHGADVVVHSVTKLLAGHSDVTLGYAVANSAELNTAVRDAAVTWGLTPSPFDCWLAERGLHTFELRYDRAQSNAASLAEALAAVPGVEAVFYPGRADHPDHLRARALFGDRGGTMVSIRLDGGRERANAFIHAAPNIPFAPTWETWPRSSRIRPRRRIVG